MPGFLGSQEVWSTSSHQRQTIHQTDCIASNKKHNLSTVKITSNAHSNFHCTDSTCIMWPTLALYRLDKKLPSPEEADALHEAGRGEWALIFRSAFDTVAGAFADRGDMAVWDSQDPDEAAANLSELLRTGRNFYQAPDAEFRHRTPNSSTYTLWSKPFTPRSSPRAYMVTIRPTQIMA